MQQGTLSGYLYVHQYGLDSNALPFTSSWSPSNPAIASLSPTSGTAGDSVSINGANFGYSQLGSTVTFNGVQANVSSWSNSSIVVQVPHSAATGNVLVTVGGVPSNGVSFTVLAPVIASLSPNAGAVGAAVTIAGTKFGQYQGSSFVYFNGSTANVTAWSDTSITVTVPNYATTGDVVVYRTAAIGFGTVLNSTSSNGVPFTVTSNPIINGLSSNSGLPGKVITISGSNFGWDQTVGTVTFNGTAAVPTSWSPTAITTTVPSGATSGNVVVTVNGVASNGVNFTVPSLTSISIAPNNPSVAVGSTQQFRATGSYSDGSTQSIGTANWTSSATSVASINGAGNATAVAQGQTVVQATVGGVVGSTTLTVTTTMGNFASTGNLTTARGGHTATLLINGKILIAGGEDGNSKSLSSAELYNPASGTFAATGSLNLARKGHTAGLLSNGMVLIAGGRDSRSVPTATAELYDPSTGTLFSTGNLNTPREYATATILNDGRVLIIGGQASFGILSSAELYDPAIGTFTATGSLNSARVYHTATLLNDGTVLVVGGQGATGTALATAELYDPSTGLFTATTANPNAARYLHTATLLNNGTVLISQGFDSSLNVLGSAELYDPANGTFTSTGSPNTPRNGASATLLGNGSVLLAGGYDSNLAGLLSAEAYDPATASFATIGNATTARRFHTATRLTNGNVLLAGGLDSSFTPLSTSELYQPATTAPAALVSIAVTPSNPSMSIGIAQRLIATGTFSNGSSQTLASVSWSSSDSAVATVTNDSTNSGSVYALATGSVTINACAGSTCGSATITVPSSQLTSIAITPANAVVVTGSSIAYFATGTYTNGGTQDLTAFVTWSSSSPSVATISAIGVATSVSTGTTTITASYGGTSASVNLSVTKPISSISISPQNPSITVGATQQFSATATYTDGTTGNVTNIVQWATQAAQVATASVGGSVTAVGQGNTVVSASSGGVTRSTNLTVTAPILTISSVSPTSGVAGTQVSVSGSGFGNTQGTGMVWLGTVPGTVVSWSDTQVIATVAMGSSSGVTRIQQNGASSNSMPFTVITPLITSLNPTSAPVGTQVTIDGSGFGGVQGNGQVWLGTTAGAVSSWSDTQIVATVAAGSTSGNAQVLQNGVFSNSVPFAVTGGAPRITGITPNSGPVGTVVAIRGTGFGSQQSNGIAWIGGTYATVLQWSDSFIVATVATNAVSGVVKAQQNGLWSNGKAFKVTGMNSGSGAMTLNPTSVSMVVGDTRALQALDAGGQQVMGLPWSSSDTSLLTLSTDDPPVLTAIAPGTVTITAGSASADVTVYTGPALALGTTIWSNPGDGSGVNNSGNIQAIQADGRVAWTASVPVNDTPMYLPDFQGGMAILDRNQESIYKLDGMTGQRYPAYAPQNHDIGAPALHTDGTVIASDASFDPAMGNITSAWVTGIDPTIGQPKFQSPTPVSTSDLSVNGQVCQLKYPNRGQTSTFAIPSDPIIAGDGFAYSTYVTSHGQTQVDDAVQPYPLGAYTAFAQLSKDMPDQSGSGGDASAVIGDIALMKAILGLPPINFSHPSGIWDDMAVAVQNGNLSQANSDRAFEAPQFVPLCNVNSSGTTELHIVKVGSDGSSSDTLVKQWQTSGNTVYGRVPNNLWSYTTTQSGFQVPVFRYFITNADQGVMLSWEALQLAYCAASTDMGCTSNVNASAEYHLTSVPGGDAIMPAAVPYQNYPIQPVLQLEDGTYVGMVWSGTTPIAEFDPNNPFTSNGILFQGTPSMVKFDASGNILGVASGYIPQMATSDGGVIGSSYSTTRHACVGAKHDF